MSKDRRQPLPYRMAGTVMATMIVLVGVLGLGGGVGGATPTYTVEALPLPAGTGFSALYGQSCPKVAHCVAVGYGGGALVETLVGTTWTDVVLNPKGLTDPLLNSVWCTSVTSCIAVGQDGPQETDGSRPLIETLSRGTWVASKPRFPKGGVWGSLSAIDCLSATTCVAAGIYGTSSGEPQALFETLSHGKWKPATTSDPAGATELDIESMQCFSTTSCDAVGYWGVTDTSSDGLLESLSGTTWTASTLGSDVLLRSLSCPSATSCLAVGYNSSGIGVTETLAGTTWTAGSLPGIDDGGTGNGIVGVSCPTNIRSCVAIGGWRPPAPNSSEPLLLIETLSHGTWTPTEISAPNGLMFPEAIDCPTVRTCIGTGTSDAPDGGPEAAVEQPPTA
jgi:hypothetical protein